MKTFINKIKNILAHTELRNKIVFTLGILLVYRVGSFIVLPGVDTAKLPTGDKVVYWACLECSLAVHSAALPSLLWV